jgi:hypothetical protein
MSKTLVSVKDGAMVEILASPPPTTRTSLPLICQARIKEPPPWISGNGVGMAIAWWHDVPWESAPSVSLEELMNSTSMMMPEEIVEAGSFQPVSDKIRKKVGLGSHVMDWHLVVAPAVASLHFTFILIEMMFLREATSWPRMKQRHSSSIIQSS